MLLSFLPLIATLLLANAGETVDLTTIWKIKDEGLNRSEVMETLSYLTDVYGPRLTGSPNMSNAQAWAKKKLEEWGLTNVHVESYSFGKGWELQQLSAEMLQPTLSPDRLSQIVDSRHQWTHYCKRQSCRYTARDRS